jgi:hypothetical protein
MTVLHVTLETLEMVAAESVRAYKKHGAGKVLTNIAMPRGEKLAALGEEFGEVCRALTYDVGDRVNLLKELIQVANLAAAWAQAEHELQALDRAGSTFAVPDIG